MTLSQTDLDRVAGATGFQVEPLEKVIRLMELLEALRSHPFLKERVALKGGTALNLFVFDVPRLSVDIDLNYVGTADRETMLEERPKVEQAVEAVCGRVGIQVMRVPTEHAGGKWRLSYSRTSGGTGRLELDVNFLLRTPLWPPVTMDSRPVDELRATEIPVLDPHELAAGKLAALFGRSASRDVFDARYLLDQRELDRARLRLGFVVYGAANRRDWRTVSLDDIRIDPTDAERHLLPMLRADLIPAPSRDDVCSWCERLQQECRDVVARVLPLDESEIAFLSRLNDDGEIAPQHLTNDAGIQEMLRAHPALRWKAQNVQEYKQGAVPGRASAQGSSQRSQAL